MSNTVYTLANGGVSEIQWYQSINYFVQDIVFFLPLLNYPKMVSVYVPPELHISLQTTISTKVFIRKYTLWFWRFYAFHKGN